MFARRDGNPHIKRLPVLPAETQIEWLETEPLDTFALYPTPHALAEVVTPTDLADRPFSRALLLGEAQLSYATFELGVLGRYRGDPRYVVKFQDYMGDMYIADGFYSSDETAERDKVSVQSFGLAIDKGGVPHIVAFYRYLSGLTAEDQQYWNSFRAPHVPMCEPYFESAVIGEWWENRSVRYAIQEEIRLINEMATAIFGPKFFRQEMSDDLPFDLSAFLVPSSDNYASFIHSWDKLLSENINRDFFAGRVDLQRETVREDGRVVVENKGTLTLLREWLDRFVTGKDKQAIIDAVVNPLRDIRKLRQAPAHSFQKNEFSKEFHAQRCEKLRTILDSLACLRTILSRHAKAGHVDVPDWLDSDQIHIF